jgi:hypothetical protein
MIIHNTIICKNCGETIRKIYKKVIFFIKKRLFSKKNHRVLKQMDNFGQFWTIFGQFLDNFGQFWTIFGQFWTIF